MQKHSFSLIAFLISVGCYAQDTYRALFLGNSYTYVNNLPQMITDMAASTGNVFIYDSNAPGGYTLQGHSSNATSLAKIAIGNWDYVVFQEQSQLPSFPISQVQTDVFPFAKMLDSTINADNPCAETVFYMTWGRKNGDASNCASWPPVCTYAGMDSLLDLRYRMMADSNNAIVSPVGRVWNYVRQLYPSLELYQPDESHPSVAGTYVAACTFYTVMFRKDPTAITFNSTLTPTDAANIRAAAKLIVFDSLMNWHVGEYDPIASFNAVVSGTNQVSFTNVSTNASSFLWYFGDGDSSLVSNPIHVYPTGGTYTVTFIATHCGISDTLVQAITATPTAISPLEQVSASFYIYPNPASTSITINHPFKGSLNYRIVNVLGAKQKTGVLDKPEYSIELAALEDGVYFIQMYQNKRLLGQQKFVKITE